MSPSQKKKTKYERTPKDREELLRDFKIRPNSDIFFATYFSDPKHEEALVNFINAVLTDSHDPPVVRAEVLNPFNIKKFAVDKSMILDVRAKDNDGRIFDIEIQVSSHLAFKERMLAYWADTYSGQFFRGDNYIALMPVISIIVVFDDIFPELVGRHQVFHLVSDENPQVRFSDHICVHVLCLKDVRFEHRENIQSWNEALQGWSLFFSCEPEELEEKMSVIVEKNPVLSGVNKEFLRYSQIQEMRELERSRMRYDAMIRIERGEAMKLKKQAKEAKAQGKAEGRAEGRAEGKAEGKAEGEAKTILTILKTRFKMEVPKRIVKELQSRTDEIALQSLAAHAVTCTSLEDFETALW